MAASTAVSVRFDAPGNRLRKKVSEPNRNTIDPLNHVPSTDPIHPDDDSAAIKKA